ncbi:DUF397 domain-containing protein [Actinomadura parmotrematis]|uniref:DUF397 domain-containing protein n=1 Tax=Actinomadura parmotrematis TaxID=2864039 RepID=A0ABS7FUY3_9ACTN|nr:DUF397 domain-containing protein [Actinomadura parmotrematis]MBW8484217.1 DUF397 domain-containing protein [Actinomadura parmotrematis]
MTDVQRELTGAAWRTSSYSGSGDQCVEVAPLTGARHAVRDSKDPHGPAMILSPAGWRGLLDSALES